MQTGIKALAIACAAFVASAAPTASFGFVGDAHRATDMPKTDFVEHAIADGMAEVALGELAASRASDPNVKAFAQQMVDDHAKANEELRRLARKLDVTPPATLDANDKAEAARLATLSGPEFDREYMRSQLADHDETLAIFERQASSSTDKDVKAWASKTIPTLRSHQERAAEVARQVGAGRHASNERTTMSEY